MPRPKDSDLRRRRPVREPKPRFVIVCEGAKTEPEYFKAVTQCMHGALIELEVIGGAGVAKTVARRAVDRKKSQGRKRNSFEAGDQVWAVFDHDDHPELLQAIMICENDGVGVGRSNPCFELWLILHIEDFQRPDDRHAIQAHLKSLHSAYDAKTADCLALVEDIEKAEERAARQLTRREEEGNRLAAPSTTVFELTRAIREAARQARRPGQR